MKSIKDTFSPILDELDKNGDKYSGRALKEVGDMMLNKADDLVPLDTGNLRNSGEVKQPKDTVVTVGYYTRYATRLHEHPEYNFRTDKNPKAQGKWLETAIKQNLSKYEKVLGKKLAYEIKSGSGFRIL